VRNKGKRRVKIAKRWVVVNATFRHRSAAALGPEYPAIVCVIGTICGIIAFCGTTRVFAIDYLTGR
jgi:hypothetical protein